RGVRRVPVADESDGHRALSRRRQPRAGVRYGLRDAYQRLQRRHRLAVGQPEGHSDRHEVVSRRLRVAGTVPRSVPILELHGRRRDRRSLGGRLRSELRAAAGDQSEVRSGQLLPRQREHQPQMKRFFAMAAALALCAAAACSQRPSAAGSGEVTGDVKKFLDTVNQTMLKLGIEQSRAGWVQQTYITDDTEALAARANQEYIDATARFAKEATRFD